MFSEIKKWTSSGIISEWLFFLITLFVVWLLKVCYTDSAAFPSAVWTGNKKTRLYFVRNAVETPCNVVRNGTTTASNSNDFRLSRNLSTMGFETTRIVFIMSSIIDKRRLWNHRQHKWTAYTNTSNRSGAIIYGRWPLNWQ